MITGGGGLKDYPFSPHKIWSAQPVIFLGSIIMNILGKKMQNLGTKDKFLKVFENSLIFLKFFQSLGQILRLILETFVIITNP